MRAARLSTLPSLRRWCFFLWLVCSLLSSWSAMALTTANTKSRSQLVSDLQTCLTPAHVLSRVARHVTPATDVDGSLSSLILVRLSKQLIPIDNHDENRADKAALQALGPLESAEDILSAVTNCLTASGGVSTDAVVEGLKVCSTLARIMPELSEGVFLPATDFWGGQASDRLAAGLQPHHLSGLKWAFGGLRLAKASDAFVLPKKLQDPYDALNLPFRIIPGGMKSVADLSVPTLTDQVQFQVDAIRTTSNRVVKERRQTAWEGDDGVAPFAYSGKNMPRRSWSPAVQATRDELVDRIGQYYDGCLLNLYPDGGSGMRYHSDPDQGTLWDNDTTVVSVGATRRFSFRELPGSADTAARPHAFVVMNGDVTHMDGDCQERFQHTVKKADDQRESAARASLVFKRTWGCGN